MTIPSLLVENHSTVLGYWVQQQFRQATVVHVDAHLDMGWTASSALALLRTCSGLSTLDFEQDSITYTQRGVFDLGSYLSTALALGTVSHIYWVIPDEMWFDDVGKLRMLLLDQTQGIEIEILKSLVEYEGKYEIRLPHGHLTICTLRTLPSLTQPVLLDIDVDFLLTFDAKMGCRPWITPMDLATSLTKRLRDILLLSVATSEHGGYTPPPWQDLALPIIRAFNASPLPNIVDRYPPGHLRGTRAYEQYTHGLTLLLQHQPEAALPLLAFATKSPNDVPGYHYAYGLALQQSGHTKQAIASYGQACSYGEPFPQMLNNLAGAWIDEGENVLAQKALEDAVAIDPESATLAANLGRLLVFQNKGSEAERWLRYALSLQPGHIEASYQLATLLLHRGTGAEGLELLTQCMELAKGLPIQRIIEVCYRRWQKMHHTGVLSKKQ